MTKEVNVGRPCARARSRYGAKLAWLLCAALAGAASAQSFPTKPVRFIVPFVPGGGTDVLARALGQTMSGSMGQQVIVDNRPGGGGLIAAVIAAKAPPYGYTLFAGSISTLATNVSMYSKLPYDPLRDFAPVTVTMSLRYLLLVNASTPVTSIKELIALAKSAPGKLSYASASS